MSKLSAIVVKVLRRAWRVVDLGTLCYLLHLLTGFDEVAASSLTRENKVTLHQREPRFHQTTEEVRHGKRVVLVVLRADYSQRFRFQVDVLTT
jgi:hypothetical protein